MIIKEVYFDNINSYKDLGLILSKVLIKPPKIKEKKIKVPCSDKDLDLTEFSGQIHYENRIIKMVFFISGVKKSWPAVFSDVSNKLHGRRMSVILPDDQSFVWTGRVHIRENDKKLSIGEIEVELDAEPYKMCKYSSLEEVEWDSFDLDAGVMQRLKDIEVSGTKKVTVIGYRKRVVPVFIVAGTISITVGDITWELTRERNKILDISIVEGVNEFTFSGQGVVSIEFRGGSL